VSAQHVCCHKALSAARTFQSVARARKSPPRVALLTMCIRLVRCVQWWPKTSRGLLFWAPT
jgi:hypothetical protein